jgi:ATP-dependent DNA ligase
LKDGNYHEEQHDTQVPGIVGGRSCWPRLKDDTKFVVTGTALAYLLPAMKINPLPAGFIFPAQPVLRLKPPVGTDWVHEIKHDGYRMIVRRPKTGNVRG